MPYEAGCRIQTAEALTFGFFRSVGNSPSHRHFTSVFLLLYEIINILYYITFFTFVNIFMK